MRTYQDQVLTMKVIVVCAVGIAIIVAIAWIQQALLAHIEQIFC